MAAIEEAIVHVEGQVWVGDETDALGPGQCAVTPRLMTVEGEGRQAEVPIESINDISQGRTPEPLAGITDAVVTVSYRESGTRRLVTIAAEPAAIDRLAAVLYRLVLADVAVIVRHPAWTDEQRHLTPPQRATLRLKQDVLFIDGRHDQIGIETDVITEYERVSSGQYGGLPITIGVYHTSGQSSIRSDVTFEANREVNLFGRYLSDRADATLADTSALRVLIVDDEPGLAEVIAELLEEETDRYSFIPLTGPLEAIDYLAENPRIDCIVSDYRMAEMNGIEFLDAVRQVRPNMPFIILTGKGDETVAEEALGTGATDYIRKESVTAQTGEIAKRVERAVAQMRPHLLANDHQSR